MNWSASDHATFEVGCSVIHTLSIHVIHVHSCSFMSFHPSYLVDRLRERLVRVGPADAGDGRHGRAAVVRAKDERRRPRDAQLAAERHIGADLARAFTRHADAKGTEVDTGFARMCLE